MATLKIFFGAKPAAAPPATTYTLSAATAVNITATGVTPRVTVTVA